MAMTGKPAQPNVKAGSRVDREQPAEHLASRAVRKAKAEGKMEGRAEAAVRIEKAIYDGSNVQALIDDGVSTLMARRER
jgi:hypothetical protein